ncbi:MAG: ATP-binding cassette domain-containing protein, partial [Pseudomonadota bacterium]|nr:ATP-binding cassette domain-containing protein [Pseudomonadota bacterium]
ILELDRGHGIPWQGNYSSWLAQKDQRLQMEEKSASARRRTIAAELEWVRANPRGRQAKGKARLQRFNELVDQEYQARSETNEIYIPPGPRLGDKVIEVDDIRKGFGEKLLIDGLSFSLPPGGIVGIIGPNGAGKSTSMRMLYGLIRPDRGSSSVDGISVQDAPDQARRRLGVLPDALGLY